jgi:hypothetical protein
VIDILIIALLQAVAGGPAAAQAPQTDGPAVSAPADTTTPAPADAAAPAEATPTAEAAPADAPREYRRERRCREVEVTGRRMPQRVCTNVMVPVGPAPATTE